MIKNLAGQSIGAQMVSAVDGSNYIGAVTVFVTGDGGVQAQGLTGSGACTHEGNGYYSYTPDASETNYSLAAFTFVGPGAISATIQVAPITDAQSAAITSSTISGLTSYSATDLITRALRLLGVIDAIETPEAEDIMAGWQSLNDMIDEWATQRQTVFYEAIVAYTLTAGQKAYTLGSGGDINIVRPLWIDRASIVPDVGAVQPLEIPIGRPLSIAQYQSIPQKDATSTYPDRIYWDHNFANGLSTLFVYPVPTLSTVGLRLYIPQSLTGFTDLHTVYAFPPAYAKALRYNLALELAPEYDRQPPALVMMHAAQSLSNLKRANHHPIEAQFDAALVGRRGRYNIYTDSY